MNKQTIHNELILELFLGNDGDIKEFLILPDTLTETLEIMLKSMVDEGLVELKDNKCYLTDSGREVVLSSGQIKH